MKKALLILGLIFVACSEDKSDCCPAPVLLSEKVVDLIFTDIRYDNQGFFVEDLNSSGPCTLEFSGQQLWKVSHFRYEDGIERGQTAQAYGTLKSICPDESDSFENDYNLSGSEFYTYRLAFQDSYGSGLTNTKLIDETENSLTYETSIGIKKLVYEEAQQKVTVTFNLNSASYLPQSLKNQEVSHTYKVVEYSLWQDLLNRMNGS